MIYFTSSLHVYPSLLSVPGHHHISLIVCLQTIMEFIAYTHSANSGNVNCNDITNSHDNTANLNQVMADENSEVMGWLPPLDPQRRHQDVRTDRFDSVGSGYLESSEFREWRSGEGGADKAVLFCYGNPGVGKTFFKELSLTAGDLSSLVIDSLCDEPVEEDIAVAAFYCDFRDQQEQTTANIIGAILKQLVAREEVLDSTVVSGKMFRKTPELVPKQTSGGVGPCAGGASGGGGGPSQQRSGSGPPVRRSGSPQKRVNDEPEVDRKGKKKQRSEEALGGDNPPHSSTEEGYFVCPVPSSSSSCLAEMATFKGLK
ncbi:hypothetical protein HOY80DRAFT_1104932 [Tuber brumale]|nr:hypothetical protein HOY80DRAFT_1104932 [Tuber brumale]